MRSIFEVQLVKEKSLRTLKNELVKMQKKVLFPKLNELRAAAHSLSGIAQDIGAEKHFAVLARPADINAELAEPLESISRS